MKVQQHTKAPIASYDKVGRLFHIHIDMFAMIDRASKWSEAYPIEHITTKKVAQTFYSGWVARFGWR